MTPKEILFSIMNAHCKNHNFDIAIKILGIPMGKFVNNTMTKCKEMLLDAITEDQAKEVINQMPFPYIETAIGYYGNHYSGINSIYWINDVLVQRKKVQSVFTGYGLEYQN